MSIENFEHIEEQYPEQDVLIICKGAAVFEDFEHKIKSILFLETFLLEVHNAINDFKKIENWYLLGNILLNESYIKSTSAILIRIDFEVYMPQHFSDFLLGTLHSLIKSSVAGNMGLTVGNNSDERKEFSIDKVKTDSRKEVECIGKLVYNNNRQCLVQYESLAFRSGNGFFKYPNAASPDIYIMDSTSLHLRGHCFVVENSIDKNVAGLIKALQESLYGNITIKIDGKEQVFKKQQQ